MRRDAVFIKELRALEKTLLRGSPVAPAHRAPVSERGPVKVPVQAMKWIISYFWASYSFRQTVTSSGHKCDQFARLQGEGEVATRHVYGAGRHKPLGDTGTEHVEGDGSLPREGCDRPSYA